MLDLYLCILDHEPEGFCIAKRTLSIALYSNLLCVSDITKTFFFLLFSDPSYIGASLC